MLNVADKGEKHKLVLAVDPAPRGFGYVLMETPNEPLDWGVCEVRFQKNRRCFNKIKKMVLFYEPEVVVLENCRGQGSRRHERICRLINEVHRFLQIRGIKVFRYSRSDIQNVFLQFGVKTKFGIAKLIGERLPVLQRRVPPERKPWMCEDARMHIFNAVSLALTYYFLEE